MASAFEKRYFAGIRAWLVTRQDDLPSLRFGFDGLLHQLRQKHTAWRLSSQKALEPPSEIGDRFVNGDFRRCQEMMAHSACEHIET